MPNNTNISNALKRKLKPGKEYNNLIPRVSCKPTKLGSGDTFFTVDQMRAMVEKYRYQTSKLAMVLLGADLQETTNNIYRFLYGHIQYQADGALQQLRSPACAWMQRRSGVDCKSFSVFASSILTNLGISHFIRQVKQPYFNPEDWTHVYVVVPTDQSTDEPNAAAKTLVIDATKHQNTEVEYLQKFDLSMRKLQHIGLNAPQDERAASIAANFNKFCNHLLENGVNAEIVNGIRRRVNESTSKGLDPQFRIVDKGIMVSGILYEISFDTEDKAYQEGLGFAMTTGAALTAGKKLLAMLPSDFTANTFGAVFANGFDLTCWNASYNETKAQEHATQDIPFLLNEYSGLAQKPSTESYNKFMNAIYGYIADSKNGQKSKFAKCTQKGYALRQKLSEDAIPKVHSVLESAGIKIVPTGNVKGHIMTMNMPSTEGRKYEWGQASDNTYTYPSARLEGGSVVNKVVQTVQNALPQASNYPQNNYVPTQAPNAQVPGTQTAQIPGSGQPPKENSNKSLMIAGGVALAAIPLFLMPMMKNKSKK